jgi:hypothetical protein
MADGRKRLAICQNVSLSAPGTVPIHFRMAAGQYSSLRLSQQCRFSQSVAHKISGSFYKVINFI